MFNNESKTLKFCKMLLNADILCIKLGIVYVLQCPSLYDTHCCQYFCMHGFVLAQIHFCRQVSTYCCDPGVSEGEISISPSIPVCLGSCPKQSHWWKKWVHKIHKRCPLPWHYILVHNCVYLLVHVFPYVPKSEHYRR